MGRKRVKTIEQASVQKKAEGSQASKKDKRALVKTGKEHGRITDMGALALAEAEEIKKREETTVKEGLEVKKKTRPPRVRSSRYRMARAKIDPNRGYQIEEAVKLVKETSLARFDGTVEAHVNTIEPVSGSLTLPHPVGKEPKVVVADEKLLVRLEEGKIDFDVLLASPQMMPKLAKYAKILGPRGLMPNPKAGTIAENPEEAAKRFTGGLLRFKTEAEAPLIHLTLGKVSTQAEALAENLQAVIEAIGRPKIKKLTLTSTMGPGVKVDITA